VAYVRKKQVKGRDYYYLVESSRCDGKGRTRTLKSLGRNPDVPDEYRHLLGPKRRRQVQPLLWDPQSLGKAIERAAQGTKAD
jgi:hypothetical protein